MVDKCEMFETVAKDEGVATTISFIFPRVTRVCLGNLPIFKKFYPEPHTIEWPMLKDIEVLDRNQMAIFMEDSVNSGEPESESQRVGIEQAIFSAEKVIPNLEHLSLDSKNVMRIQQGHIPVELFHCLKQLRLHSFDDECATFPYWLLEAIPTLEILAVRESSFRKIFRGERHGWLDTLTTNSLQIKQLFLWALPNLENICPEGFQLDPTLELLELLEVHECSSFMKLVPSIVSFRHLTYLDVWNCESLVYLVASSTAKSFVQLRELRVRQCRKIQEIVVKEGDEDSEISFSCLKFLDLQCLPKLFSFCSSNLAFQFPLLENVIVKECRWMKVFFCGVSGTPRLQKIHIDENTNKAYWEGNLNATMEKLFKDRITRQENGEDPCDICGHYYNYEEVCPICGHRRILASLEQTTFQVHFFPSLILPEFLYLGNFHSASYFELLKAVGISFILNTVPSRQILYPSSFTYHSLPISHDKAWPFDEAVQFLEKCEKDKVKVLVHCMSGNNRSPAIVTAYLMKSKGWRFAKSYQWVKERRPSVELTEAVYRQLQEYERGIYGSVDDGSSSYNANPRNPNRAE